MSALAPDGVTLGDGVEIGTNVRFRPPCVVHDRTVIGDGSRIEEFVVLGKRPELSGRSRMARDPVGPLVLGQGVSVCAGAIVCAGTTIGADVFIGDQAHVRERVEIGEQSVVGRAVGVESDVRIGARVKLQSGVYVTAFTLLEDDVFLGPGVTMANDDTIGRRPQGVDLTGPRVRRGARVGSGAVLVPGVEIGEEAFVAAGAVVTRDVPAGARVAGVPARPMRGR